MATTIQTLREVVPTRPLTFTESLRIAELQASKLLALAALSEPPFTENIIGGTTPHPGRTHVPAPVSGAAQWAKRPLADRR